MKGVYIFMAFQILMGVWLFISPLVLQVGEPSARISNMIFGALVAIFLVQTACCLELAKLTRLLGGGRKPRR